MNGFIKTNFNAFSANTKTIGYGSITDGTYKLEIQVSNFDHKNYYKKGEQIQVKGYVKIASKLYFRKIFKKKVLNYSLNL